VLQTAAQSKQIFLSIDKCDDHTLDISCLRTVKVVFYPHTVQVPSTSGTRNKWAFEHHYREQLIRKPVPAGAAQMNVNVLAVMHFTSW
jgi:hypothetical protein